MAYESTHSISSKLAARDARGWDELVDESPVGYFPAHLAEMALEPSVAVSNAESVRHRSRNLAVVLGALTAGACSVYGPWDLPSADGNGGTFNGGKGGQGG